MEALQIEILNPKAIKLIKGMQELDLIRVKSSGDKLKAYLKSMRRNAATAPDLDEITKITEEVRAQRYAKK